MHSQILFTHNSDGILQLEMSWLELGLVLLASNTKKGTTGEFQSTLWLPQDGHCIGEGEKENI